MDIESKIDVLEALDLVNKEDYSKKVLDKISYYKEKLIEIETQEELDEFYDNSGLEGFIDWLGLAI